MFTVALAKGALLKESVSMFSNVGIDFSVVLEDSNRQLMVPSACGRAKALLVRNSDVPVYVSYGQAQLGIVGFDVLKEQKLQVEFPLIAELLVCGVCSRLSIRKVSIEITVLACRCSDRLLGENLMRCNLSLSQLGQTCSNSVAFQR